MYVGAEETVFFYREGLGQLTNNMDHQFTIDWFHIFKFLTNYITNYIEFLTNYIDRKIGNNKHTFFLPYSL